MQQIQGAFLSDIILCFFLKRKTGATRGGVHWDLRYRRNLQNREVDEFQRLMEILYKQNTTLADKDSWSWGQEVMAYFSVKLH